MLHHPEYRKRYAANLKRELPRIPFVGGTESAERDTNIAQGVSPGSPAQNDSESLQGRHKTAGPSARAEALGRDDKPLGVGGRGPEGPLYPNDSARGDKAVFWAIVEAGRNLPSCTSTMSSNRNIRWSVSKKDN